MENKRVPWNKGKKIWITEEQKENRRLIGLKVGFQKGHSPHPNWIKKWIKPRIEKICPICNKKFKVRQKRLDNNRGITCSRKCGNISAGIKKSNNGNGWTEDRKKRVSGYKNPNWKGKRMDGKDYRWVRWRNKVFKRDNYTCVFCGRYGGKLHPHHIKQFAYHMKLRYITKNGITLCVDCHRKTPTYGRGGHLCCK